MSGARLGLSEGWSAAIEEWARHARSMGSPSTTIATRRQHLSRTGRTLGVADPWQVTGADLVAWTAGQSWAVETRRAYRTTLRCFYRWAVEEGYVLASPALALRPVRPLPPRPRPTPELAYRTALAAAGARERLMLRLAAEAGLRRAEVAQVHSRDLIEDLAGWSLVVHGKGGRDRVVPLPDGLATALRGRGPGWVFPGDDGGHLSPRWVGKVVGSLLPEGWTMHTLRHRFATLAHRESGADVFVVQELLGHASPATTRAYVAVASSKLRATVNAVSAA